MALQMGGMGGGGAMAMGGGGAMPLQAMPMQQAMPRFDNAPPPAGAAPGRAGPAPGSKDVDAKNGGDADGRAACLALEFSGASVLAACWDAASLRAVPLPFDADRTGACPAAVSLPRDAAPLEAWRAKAPRTRAAEAHASGCVVGKRGGGGSKDLVAPGAWLGAKPFSAKWAGPGAAPSKAAPPADDDGAEEDFGSGDQGAFACGDAAVAPALAVALLLARPRQRATQLAKRPVKAASVVAPARASASWRLAALDALAAVDCAAGAVVAAPLATVVGVATRDPALLDAASLEALRGDVLAVDVGCHGVEAVRVKCADGAFDVAAISGDSLAGDKAALVAAAAGDADLPKATEQRVSKAIAKALKSVGGGGAPKVIVRGEGSLQQVVETAVPACVAANGDDAVKGAAVLAAAGLGLPGCPDVLATGALARDVSVAQLTRGKVDAAAAEPLFAAGAPLPCSARRTYDRAALLKASKLGKDAELSWAFVEDGAPIKAGCEDPFETVDDDDEVQHAERATVEYVVDGRGVPSATLLVAAAPKNAERVARKAAEKRCYFYLKVFLIGFVALPGSLTLFHMGRRTIRRGKTVAILDDFYARANPDKVGSSGSIADKYEGFEELLYKRLERQYPEHKIHRKGPPFPERAAPADSAEDEDEVEDLDAADGGEARDEM